MEQLTPDKNNRSDLLKETSFITETDTPIRKKVKKDSAKK